MTAFVSSDAEEQAANQVALSLLANAPLPLEAPVLTVGSGSCSFLHVLLEEGFTNLLAVDVDAAALAYQARQLPLVDRDKVLWVVEDVLHAQQLPALDPILLWHDRAVWPALEQPAHQAAYKQLLDHMLMPGRGWLLLGLAPAKVDVPASPLTHLAQLLTWLGPEYALQKQGTYSGGNEEGVEPLNTYALFRRLADVRQRFRH